MSQDRINFDDYTENYNNLLHEGTRFFTESESYFARYKVDVLRHVAPVNTKRLLEYGCGIGRNIPFLGSAFPNATIFGSDISAASLEVARAENPAVKFFLEDADAPVAEPYEVIFAAGVFHHVPLPERQAVMNALFARLAPGGVVVIFEHNPFNPVTRKIVSECPYDRDATLLAPAEMKSLLSKAGLQVSRTQYCLFVPPSLSWLLPLERWLGWLPLGGQYWVTATRAA